MQVSIIMFLRGLGGTPNPIASWEFHPPTTARWRLRTAHFPSSYQQWEVLPVSQHSQSDPRQPLDHRSWMFLPRVLGNLTKTEQIAHYWDLERENKIWDSLKSVINVIEFLPVSREQCFFPTQIPRAIMYCFPKSQTQWDNGRWRKVLVSTNHSNFLQTLTSIDYILQTVTGSFWVEMHTFS